MTYVRIGRHRHSFGVAPVTEFGKIRIHALYQGAGDGDSNSHRAAANVGERQWLARYDQVQFGIYDGLQSTAHSSMQAMRVINPDVKFINYTILNELRDYRINRITKPSSTRARLYYDSKYETMSISSTAAGRAWINCPEHANYSGEKTVLALGTEGAEKWFEFAALSGDPALSSSNGEWMRSNQASLARWKILSTEGLDWWLRDAVTGEHVLSNQVNTADEINLMNEFTTPDSQGRRWPQRKADWDKENWFALMPLLDGLFIDNFFAVLRTSGEYFMDGSNQSTSTSAVKAREGYMAYLNKLRADNAGKYFIPNVDHDCSSTQYLGQLDGGFMEANPAGLPFETTNDNWSTFMTRYRGVVNNCGNASRTVLHVRGQGTTLAEQVNDFATLRKGMAAFLMQNGGYLCFVPTSVHDPYCQGLAVWPDEYDARLGNPIEGPQNAARGIAGSPNIWMRKFENGAVIYNTHFTNSQTVPFSALGSGYKRIAGTADPFWNDGRVVTGDFGLFPKTAEILVRTQNW